MTSAAATPEQLKGEDWAGEQGREWLAHIDRFEGMIAPIGEALLARAGIAPGERVIDLGCGGGLTSLALAEAAGPDGAVLTMDEEKILRDAQRIANEAWSRTFKTRFKPPLAAGES